MHGLLMNNIATLAQEAHSSCPLPSALTRAALVEPREFAGQEREEQLAVHFSLTLD